jgi:hypothetical protein
LNGAQFHWSCLSPKICSAHFMTDKISKQTQFSLLFLVK